MVNVGVECIEVFGVVRVVFILYYYIIILLYIILYYIYVTVNIEKYSCERLQCVYILNQSVKMFS